MSRCVLAVRVCVCQREGKVRGACKLQRVKSCKGKFLSNATISLAHTHTQLLKVATVSDVYIRTQARHGKAVSWVAKFTQRIQVDFYMSYNKQQTQTQYLPLPLPHCGTVCASREYHAKHAHTQRQTTTTKATNTHTPTHTAAQSKSH